jgi:hypothetical protein
LTSPLESGETATGNESLLRLVKEGFPEAVVIQYVNSASEPFDTSLAALVALKNGGVTEATITAVLAKQARSSPDGQGPASAAASDTARNSIDRSFVQIKIAEGGVCADVGWLDIKGGRIVLRSYYKERVCFSAGLDEFKSGCAEMAVRGKIYLDRAQGERVLVTSLGVDFVRPLLTTLREAGLSIEEAENCEN